MRWIILAAVLAVLAVPAASAHASYQSDDGRYTLVVGHQDEPTATYLRSGLDFIVRDNELAEGAEPVELNVHQTASGTITSPSGATMDCVLRLQHGATNRYQCDDAYVLTEPGQYVLTLDGTVGDVDVSGDYNISRALPEYTDLTFPDDVHQLLELESRIAALESQLESLEARLDSMEAPEDDPADRAGDEAESVPGPGVMVIGGLLGTMLVVRRLR